MKKTVLKKKGRQWRGKIWLKEKWRKFWKKKEKKENLILEWERFKERRKWKKKNML